MSKQSDHSRQHGYFWELSFLEVCLKDTLRCSPKSPLGKTYYTNLIKALRQLANKLESIMTE